MPAIPTRLGTSSWAAALAVLALAVLFAGCGSSSNSGVASKSPAEIFAASKAAAEAAASVSVTDKASQGRLTSTSSLQLASDGGHAQVSFLGLAYEVLRIGGTIYLKGSPGFYAELNAASGNALGKVPKGTWVKAPANGGDLAQVAAVTYLRRELPFLLGIDGQLTKGATTTVDGQKAIELKETARLFSGSLYIATTGKPYPIELIKHGRENAKTTFSNWNQSVALNAPAGATAIK